MRALATVIALTLAVVTLAPATAFADGAPPASSSAAAPPAAPPAPTGTPLSVRTPVAAAPAAPTSSHLGFKLAAMCAIAAGGYFLWKRRRALVPSPETARLDVVRRVSIGVRSELLVVDVEGRRLLLGVTPAGISRLSTLGRTDALPRAVAEEAVVREPVSAPPARADEESRASLESLRRMATESVENAPSRPDLEEQVRGLRALRRALCKA